MKTLSKISISLFCVLGISAPLYASIEGVASPTTLDSLGNVYRYTVYRTGNKVRYGECDTLESYCLPSSPLLKVQREMPFEDYVSRLAEHFGVNATYLLHHERAIDSISAYLETLDGIVNGDAASDEKALAKAKYDAVLDAGGMLDRFLQALQIKLSLDEKTPDDFEKQRELLNHSRKRVNGDRAGKGTERSGYSLLQGFFGDLESLHLKGEQKTRLSAYATLWSEAKGMEGAEGYADQIVQALLDASYLRSQQANGTIGPLLALLAKNRELSVEINPAEDFKEIAPIFRRYMNDERVEYKLAGMGMKPLDSEGSVTFEQSVKQFEQAFWPVNFAADVSDEKPEAATRFEPSTLRTWHLGHANSTRKEAESHCARAGKGYRMADTSDVGYSASWLLKSSIGTEMGYTSGARLPVCGCRGLKGVRGKYLRTVKKQVEIYRNNFREQDVPEHELEVHFMYMMVGGPECEVRSAKVGTGEVYKDGHYSQEELLKWADKAGEAAVLCFKERFK
ncbi:MAG: hypothetical protein R3B54_07930 [Bdellovibrionota bacterium]